MGKPWFVPSKFLDLSVVISATNARPCGRERAWIWFRNAVLTAASFVGVLGPKRPTSPRARSLFPQVLGHLHGDHFAPGADLAAYR